MMIISNMKNTKNNNRDFVISYKSSETIQIHPLLKENQVL